MGAIQVSMLLRNVQQMKDFLGDALDHVRPDQSVKQNEPKVSNDNMTTDERSST